MAHLIWCPTLTPNKAETLEEEEQDSPFIGCPYIRWVKHFYFPLWTLRGCGTFAPFKFIKRETPMELTGWQSLSSIHLRCSTVISL